MKRRNFLQTVGVASAVLSSGSLMAFNRFQGKNGQSHSPEELKQALDSYFSDLMAGKYFNPNVMPVNNKVFVVKNYSIDVVSDKNTIFDIADIVIKRLRSSGFNAKDLKNGIIPEGLTVGAGFVRLPNQAFAIRIEELRNYDATISIKDHSVIRAEIIPAKWKTINSFKERSFSDGSIMYEGNNGFRLTNHDGRVDSKPLKFNVNVNVDTTPVQVNEFLPDMAGMGFITSFFSQEQLKTIKI